ncbi:nucleolar protein 6 isoform X2 [Latimeria chalumnae]|uniref:nucleolar protein 6 isoform X2 n=1 Tax=Latimeria chalumnae TaxID=7897 RepID=UPI00313D6486
MKRKVKEAVPRPQEEQAQEAEGVEEEGKDDENLEKEENVRGPSKKKGKFLRENEEAGEGILKPVTLSKKDLYKPPTNEELNQLKETENLFHSSLLRLQIEELLMEVELKEKKRKRIDSFLHEVNNLLNSIPETQATEIMDQSWVPKDVKVPFLQVPSVVKGRFRFLPPASIKVVGSYLLGTCMKPEINVDVMVTMPAAVLQEKDYLNQRYHRKRALYLTHLAHHLSKEQVFGSVKFAYMNSNHLKPVLLLKPQGKDEKLVTVRLHVCAPPGFFKPGRFHPSKNNVRTAWFLEQDSSQEGTVEPPTPHYNNSVLCDLVMEPHLRFLFNAATDFPGMKHGIILLKVWLHQRNLDKGFGCFNGFLASMLVAYLVSKHKISKMMSGYQVLRNVLQFLATTDLTVSGITVSRCTDNSAPTVADFHQAFEVVFVDPSGYVNLCADLTASKYKQIQFEAKQSMEILDDSAMDGFQMLLMTPKPLIRTFDHVFHLKNVAKLQGACRKMKLLNELMDHSGNYVTTTLPYILSLLTRGLGRRIHLLSHVLPQTPEWPIGADPPKHKDIGHLSFGLLLDSEFAADVLDKGPQADQPEAAEFRSFWGEKSELRRFQDGSICEAVVWPAQNLYEKRLVPEQIIRHLLQLHADIPETSVCYMGGLLDSVVKLGKGLAGTGEEENVSVVRSYDDLSRKLWNLEGLPLNVTSVQGTHPALRYTDVFPPVPVKPDYSYHVRVQSSQSLLPVEEKPCPAYVPALKVICHLEGTGKWPQEKEGIKRIRAAFHIRLAELLNQHHKLTCRPCVSHMDIYKDGYVFRVQVAYHREPQILKETVTPDGMLKFCDTEESQQLEMETVHLPYLTSTLHGLQQLHSAFSGTCRLAKRWVSAQLLSDGVPEECIDLLAAYLFLHPAPYSPPSSPQVGFLRFLSLLSTFDWKTSPLIVNLNGDIKDVDYAEIKNDFVAARAQLPVMFIATPRDRKSSIWTKGHPTAQILQRVIVLALESLRALETQLMDPTSTHDVKMVFRPPLDFYDAIIHLNPKQIPRHLEAVDKPKITFCRGMLKSDAPVKFIMMPVVDYDPVQCYLQELKTSQVNGRMLQLRGNDSQMVPNVRAIVDDLQILGEGLVQSVEARTEKWTI